MADRQLEKYRLLEEVGQGGMAVVYRGLDTALNREVAVKILHPHLADQDESKQRFQREAHAVAKLRHANILEIYDYSGLESADSYIVTEFIHGHTLKAFLARNPISHPEIAAMIIVEVCRALGHAHGLGVIHRDIKPENIMIRQDGRIKLTDFGIAQIIDVQRMTVTGQLLGSPAYMTPELVEGKPIDFRSDIFSVGTLLYQLATEQLPFKGKNPHEMLKRIADCKFVPAEVVNPLVGDRLGAIISRALARDPADRYAKVGDLEQALTGFLADVDITETSQELATYFADPEAYSRDLQLRVVRKLTDRGRAEFAAGRAPQALHYFDRVLCADPRNAEVVDLLDRINRRRRIGRVAAVLAMVAALGGAAYLVSTYLSSSHTKTSTHAKDGGAPLAAMSTDASRATAVSGTTAPLKTSPDAATASTRGQDADVGTGGKGIKTSVRPTKRPHNGTPAIAPPREVQILPTPKAMGILVNGTHVGNYGPDLRSVTLPPGDVTLTFRNGRCCYDRVITIAANQRPESLRVKLRWKPGRLRVNVSPAGVKADVIVGRMVGRAGEAFEVPIPSYSTNGRSEIDVRISAAGFAPVARKVEVRANTTSDLNIKLAREG